MNDAFTWCVKLLEYYAQLFNMTYEELNIWIFCIIEPIVFLLMLFIIIKQFVKIKKLKKSKTNQ